MKKQSRQARTIYSSEFKKEAIELAKEIGVAATVEKLGIKSPQTLGAWLRYDKKVNTDAEFKEVEQLKSENKKLKKELDLERKAVAILRDAAAFFCQDHLK